jgi:hypothetical protein
MGLLDDAIKEHLELKRRRGADAEEVARLEQEALGPPQRGEFAGATAPAQPAEPAEVAPDPLSPEEAAAPAPEPEPALEPPVEPEPLPDRAPEPEPEPEPSDRAAPGWLEDEREPLPEEPEEVPEGEPVILDQHTVEYAVPAEPPAEGDDVLEETPDFLQETPEHDRLWFEQKPPRDFDLDR